MSDLAPLSETVLRCHEVGKTYRFYRRPIDRLKELVWRGARTYGEPFEALHPLSFEVQRGQALAVIGQNGSGKSTLLQLLAGVLRPTTGQLEQRGRVAALLELGSGFHADFTGRENVMLNGTILGLQRREVLERLDGIAEFADIGEFLDHPISVYSSGMRMRLAFAVATSVDADCLLIDEALAVGDVFFRQKCYARLAEMRSRGTAVVLVTHAMSEVEQFCDSAILLEQGREVFRGDPSEAVQRYYLRHQSAPPTPESLEAQPLEPGAVARRPDAELNWPDDAQWFDLSVVPQVEDGGAKCLRVGLTDSTGRSVRSAQQGQSVSFWAEFELCTDVEVPSVGITIHTDSGLMAHGKGSVEHGSSVPRGLRSGSVLRFRQDVRLDLAVGDYTFGVGVGGFTAADYERRAQTPTEELARRQQRLCVVPQAGAFALLRRTGAKPVELQHHGLVDLPGAVSVEVIAGSEAGTRG